MRRIAQRSRANFPPMPTNTYVESCFHNFEALFVPQQHPARDQQDTFFVADPPKADRPRPANADELSLTPKSLSPNTNDPEKKLDYERYWDNVHAVHQDGKFGSIGYRYPWKEDEALRLVLRTHTTATSAAMLHKLSTNPRPARYCKYSMADLLQFMILTLKRIVSIDRVFRNETVDATHVSNICKRLTSSNSDSSRSSTKWKE